jgi:hypothetical protein
VYKRRTPHFNCNLPVARPSSAMEVHGTASWGLYHHDVVRTESTKTLEVQGSSDMVPPFRALRLPGYLMWWSYVFLLALSPLPALTQESSLIAEDDCLSNGCRWDNLSRELNCSSLGLTRIPYIHPNCSGIMRQLNLVNNSLEKVTVEDIKDFAEVTLLGKSNCGRYQGFCGSNTVGSTVK